MNWYEVFYWMTVADNVKTVFGWLTIIAGIYTIVSLIAALGAFDDPWDEWAKSTKIVSITFLITFVLSISLWVFIPSKKDMIVIVAGGSVGNFITTDSSSRAIPAELTKYIRNYIQKEAEDMDYDVKEDLGVATPKDKFIEKVKDLSKDEIIEYLKQDSSLLK